MASLIVVLLVVFLVALFSVQNASPVAISFLFWRFEASLAIVIFLSALGGALATFIIYSSRAVKKAISAKKTPAEIPPTKPTVKE